MGVRGPTLTLAVTLAACSADFPADLGDSPHDEALVADTPALAHLAGGIDDPDVNMIDDSRRWYVVVSGFHRTSRPTRSSSASSSGRSGSCSASG